MIILINNKGSKCGNTSKIDTKNIHIRNDLRLIKNFGINDISISKNIERNNNKEKKHRTNNNNNFTENNGSRGNSSILK